ncbi:MAG: hypothetical protein ABR595_05275 [Psychroflexus sp.]
MIQAFPSRRKNNIGSATQDNDVYILQSHMRGKVDLKHICKRISDSCTLTEADVMACISQLNFQVMDLVAQGYKVDLDDLGSFKIGLRSDSKSAPNALKKSDIKSFRLNYQASKNMKRKLKAGFDVKIIR